jgi:hypothetical protein
MDIRNYPGENVTTFVQDAVKIVRELQMNFMSDDAMPELTLTALEGLSHSSDPGLKQEVGTLRLASDVNGFGFSTSIARPDALSALQRIADLYRVLVNVKDYAPAESVSTASKLQAMVAAAIDAKIAAGSDTKLTQNRDAGGAHGGGGKPRGALIVVPLNTFAVAPTAPNQNLPLGVHPLLLALAKAAMAFPKPSLSRLRPSPRSSFLRCQQGRIFQTMPSTASRLMNKPLESTVEIVVGSPMEPVNTTQMSTKGPPPFLTRELPLFPLLLIKLQPSLQSLPLPLL